MMPEISTLMILLIALIVDRFVGDPDWLWRRFSHPVVLFGKAIEIADKQFNHPETSELQREKLGFISIAVLLIAVVVMGLIASSLFERLGFLGTALEIAILAVFLAQKSLADHVKAVATGLRQSGLEGGRSAVSMIVGRKPETLDESGVCRAAVESLAENASDGVVAPALWYAVFGLPGLFVYKLLNTADSMIGHKTDRHRSFGRASAKLDDLASWVPARLTAMFIILSRSLSDIEENVVSLWRNAKLHRSPNAGWPESAMAIVLGIALGGPRIYDGDMADEPFMNASGRQELTADDIDAAIAVFYRAMLVGMGFLLVWILISR
jgi:adenosylcobinamide-phosphate synthase